MARPLGKTDLEKLAAYLSLKLQELTGDATLTVNPARPERQYEGGPKLEIQCDGNTNLNIMGPEKLGLPETLDAIFKQDGGKIIEGGEGSYKTPERLVYSCADDHNREIKETGRYHQPLFVNSAFFAVRAADQNDPEVFARSAALQLA